ncbi:TPA: hypothetical protein ACHT4P_005251, partial [Klebsiella quasipneumoniae]
MPVDFVAVEPDSIQVVSKRADLADRCFIIRINDSFKGTVAKLAMRQPFV